MTELDESGLPLLPPRPATGHKGTFGTVLIVGGCALNDHRMIGAPALAALGALRAGAGLAKLAMPAPVLDAGLAACPSATGRGFPVDAAGQLIPHTAAEVFDEMASEASSLVIGPGLGPGDGPAALALRAAQHEDAPVVIDADALNALAGVPQLSRDFRAAAILTPHPGEFRRLAQALGITHDPVHEQSRPLAAAALAQRMGCVVVLKGAGTVVSDGLKTWVCRRGHSCLATAGTGDVLSGVLGGLLAAFAQRPSAGRLGLSLYDIARLGVTAHAAAGEAWALRSGAQAGMLAAELADLIPGALETMRAG